MFAELLEEVGYFAVYFVGCPNDIASVVQRYDHRSREEIDEVSELRWKILIEIFYKRKFATEVVEGYLFAIVAAHCFGRL